MEEQEEVKFLRILTNLLGHEPSKEEMQKILEPLNELGKNSRDFILHILEDIISESDENERIKKIGKFVTELKLAKDEASNNHKAD